MSTVSIDGRQAQHIGWIQHVNGWTEFCGLRIEVDPGVFVPRHRSEFLVRVAAELLPPRAVVVDLCCGSGAVGVTLCSASRGIELHGVDLDPAAVACARRNVAPVGGRVYEGDLLAPLPADLTGRVDVIVGNAPYITSDESGRLPLEVRLYESRMAFDGGSDGLDIHRRLLPEAGRWLAPGGYLVLELHESQVSYATELFTENGLTPRVMSSAEADATVIVGVRSEPDATGG